jgi:hypothetical protein
MDLFCQGRTVMRYPRPLSVCSRFELVLGASFIEEPWGSHPRVLVNDLSY